MPPTNEILPFCATDTGTNLLTEAEYTASSDRTSGNKPGVASAKLNNKALRQSSFIASQLAQMVANSTNTNVLDDGISAKLLAQFTSALSFYAPRIQKFDASGTYNATYIFAIATGSATVGATYTNNTVTYTVVETIAAGTVLRATGNGAPTASGTLTKATGTGDATITFYAVRKPIAVVVEAVGAGGGGGGGGIGSDGIDGSDTTFGGTLIVAGGGKKGTTNGGTVGQGGTPSNTLTDGIMVKTEGAGGGYAGRANATTSTPSPQASGTPFGGGGGGGTPIDNTGAGGAGGSFNGLTAGGSAYGGSSGGSGAYFKALIAAPASTYAVVIGTGGTGGAGAGSGGINGAAGASGACVVMELYQ